MVECASLKSTSASSAKQSRIRSKYAKLVDEPDKNHAPVRSVRPSSQVIHEQVNQNDIYHEPLVPRDQSDVIVEHEDSFTLVTSLNNQTNYETIRVHNIHDSEGPNISQTVQKRSIQAHSHNLRTLPSRQNDSDLTELEENREDLSDNNSTNSQINSNKLNRNANPKINYDREGKVVSIQYPNETLSMIKTNDNDQHQAHIVALKHKVRHYQRKLAVINHRYQKLRSQLKGRSNKMRLLECLNICKSDFNPCLFEIIRRQIKGPSSKQGNRWSNEVKTFSSSIYLRSRSAYKFIRNTIDLPSESIVKRFISDKKLSKALISVDQDDEDDETEEDINGQDGGVNDDGNDNTLDIRNNPDQVGQ